MAKTKPATESDMRAFGASDVACVRWPKDTAKHRDLRAAYLAGAADGFDRELDLRNAIKLVVGRHNLISWHEVPDRIVDALVAEAKRIAKSGKTGNR